MRIELGPEHEARLRSSEPEAMEALHRRALELSIDLEDHAAALGMLTDLRDAVADQGRSDWLPAVFWVDLARCQLLVDQVDAARSSIQSGMEHPSLDEASRGALEEMRARVGPR